MITSRTQKKQKLSVIKHCYPIKFCEVCGNEIEKFRKKSPVCMNCYKLIRRNLRWIRNGNRCVICLDHIDHGRYCHDCQKRVNEVKKHHPTKLNVKIYIYKKK